MGISFTSKTQYDGADLGGRMLMEKAISCPKSCHLGNPGTNKNRSLE